jgi:hypothetical protein
MSKVKYNIWSFIDAFIYFFIGPFNALYIIPLFFRRIESSLGIKLQQFFALNIIGTVLMWVGLLIAV